MYCVNYKQLYYSQNGNSVQYCRLCAVISITTHHIAIPLHREILDTLLKTPC